MQLRNIVAPKGLELSTENWQIEAVLRMLMNNLDHAVAENPDELIVCGGRGKAVRNWQCYEYIIETLKKLKADETLLIQSGKPIGVLKTHENAPRVLLANSNLVPNYANWETFFELERKGLIMYGQCTPGSWMHIGLQGIIQGTYQTFIACAKKHYNKQDLRGQWLLSSGLGGMGGAQPIACKLAKGSSLVVEFDPIRIEKRLKMGLIDVVYENLDAAIKQIENSCRVKDPVAIGFLGNIGDVLPILQKKGVKPDILTDQTSAHDPLYGYVPKGWLLHELKEKRRNSPQEVIRAAKASIALQVKSMLEYDEQGVPTFDFGNNIRQIAYEQGVTNAYKIKGFVEAYLRPIFSQGISPLRWMALSGDPQDLCNVDDKIKDLFPQDLDLHAWLSRARQHIPLQGLPARVYWFDTQQKEKIGIALNEMVATQEVSAPLLVTPESLADPCSSSPSRDTENMRDGSDMVADWPLLSGLLSSACGATWVYLQQGGGTGVGSSQNTGFGLVLDGSKEATHKVQMMLRNSSGLSVMRLVDAGYDSAVSMAEKENLHIPMLTDFV